MKAFWLGVVGASLSLSFLPALGQDLPASCGPKDQILNVKTTKTSPPSIRPIPGKATLVFINSESNCWGCTTVNVGVDGKWIGGNKGNSWFAVDVAPGNHLVCAYVPIHGYPLRNKVRLTELNAESGKVYFVTTDILANSVNIPSALNLQPVSPNEGNFLLSNSSHASWTPRTH